MTSNITAISSASPPPVKILRPKVDPPEDAARQARNGSDPVIQSGIASMASETPSAKAITPGAKAQDAKDQGARMQDARVQDARALTEAVDELNRHFKGLPRTNLQFNVDDKTDQIVVKVMDVEKDEVIRQIPPEEILKLAAFLTEKAEKEARQMERAAGLASEASPLGGLLLHAKV